MKLKGFLAGAAAVLFASVVAGAANLSLLSGPQDPSQLLATINTVIQNINFGVNGRLTAMVTGTGSASTTENTMANYSLPANRLVAAGDAVRVICWGTSATNSNSKVVKLYFGGSSVATSSIQQNFSNKNWLLKLTVLRSGAATQQVMGEGAIDGLTSTVYVNSGTDALTAAVTIKCTATTATAAQDVTAQGMLVEQIK